MAGLIWFMDLNNLFAGSLTEGCILFFVENVNCRCN